MNLQHRTATCDLALAVQLRPDFDTTAVSESSEDGFVMWLATTLPDMCSAHGRSAIAKRAKDIRFRRSAAGWRQRTASTETLALLSALGRLVATVGMTTPGWVLRSGPNGVLEGEWPVCVRCLRDSLVYRWIGHALVAAGPVLFAVAFALSTMGIRPIPLVIALFPGWLPCALVVATLAYIRAGTFVHIRPIIEATTLTLRAHPAFASAFEHGDSARER